MIEHAHQTNQLLLSDLYDLKPPHLKRVIFNSTNNSTDLLTVNRNLKSANSRLSTRITNLNNSLDKKLAAAASDESLALSITAAVAELRPCPEILPFSVDLPIKCKFTPLVRQR